MAKGIRVQEGKKLVAYNAKLEADTRDLLGAVVQVKGLEGQRDLIDRMLAAYEKENPGTIEKAQQLLDLTKNK